MTYELLYCGEGGEFDVGVGDFWIYNHETGAGSYKLFFDKDGNLVKEKGHINGIDRLFADGYSEHMVSGSFNNNWTAYFDPETGEPLISHEPGNWWNIQLPGYGNLVHFAGLEVYAYVPDTYDWHLIKDEGLRYADLVALCEYLEPPE